MDDVIAFGMTARELIKYRPDVLSPEQILDLSEKEISELTEQVKREELREELREEQLYFAQELFFNIQKLLDDSTITRCKDLREAIQRSIESSYFEG